MRAPADWWAAVTDLFTGVPADGDGGRPSPAPPAAADEAFGTRVVTQLLRHPGRLISACLVTVLGPAVIAHASSPGDAVVAYASSPGNDHVPETRPAGDLPVDPPIIPVPGDALTWLPAASEAAATCPGLPTAVLVAIGHVESSLGLQPWPSSAGAVGPMQFLPATWDAYGADGDGDGHTDVMNPVDAIHGAANLLCANGGADPAMLESAVWNYNRSDEYVRHVMTLARFMAPATLS